MNIYRESIQEFTTIYYTVRVWREKHPSVIRIIPQHDDDVSDVLNRYAPMSATTVNRCEEMAEAVLKLARVNAVEVKDRTGNGCVLYDSEEVEINHRRITIT